MTLASALALSAFLATAGCRQERHPMSSDALLSNLRSDFQGRRTPKIADAPLAALDGGFHTPAGAPITFQGVISWTRPAQNEGVPLTAYYSATEQRYWVKQAAGGLGGDEIWFGPFDLRP
jgi:hypothetical protein